MAATNIHTHVIGEITLQSGNGAPTHVMPIGCRYIDADSGIQYKSHDSGTWHVTDTEDVVSVDFLNRRVGVDIVAPAEKVHVWMTDENQSESDQDNDVMVDGSALSDKGFVMADQGNRRWQQNIYRGEDGEFMYVYNFEAGTEIVVYSETMKTGFNKQSNILDYHTCYMDPGNGLLDDCAIGGTFSSTQIIRYEIKITHTDDPDMFAWRKSVDFGSTWTAWSAEIRCQISDYPIDNGVTVRFDETNGHNTYDRWQVNAFPQNPVGTLTIGPPQINEVNSILDYTDPSTDYRDLTFAVSSNDMPDTTIFYTGASNSAVYLGRNVKFDDLYFEIITPAIGMTPIVEYWNGSQWTAISTPNNILENTAGFTTSGDISWNKGSLTNWVKRFPEYNQSEDGYYLYWIRVRSSSTITQAPVVRTITAHGKYRLALFAAHNDSRPSMYVDVTGKTVIGKSNLPATGSLTVNGSIASKIDEITVSTLLNDSHNILLCYNDTDITLQLPATSSSINRIYSVIPMGAGSVTLDAYSAETVNGTATYTCSKRRAYNVAARSGNWVLLDPVGVAASEIDFTPNGDIASTNVQSAVQEVRDDAAYALGQHTSNTSNPHSVTPSQLPYVSAIYDTTNVKETLDTFSEMINETIGTGVLTNSDYLTLHAHPFTTRVDVSAGDGYVNYTGFFKKVSWDSTFIDFAIGSPAWTTNIQYYIYSDVDGVIHAGTSLPNIYENIMIGRVFWNGLYASNLSQTGRISHEALTNMYDYLTKLGTFIYDNGCLVGVRGGLGNEMKPVSAQGNALRGLKKYALTEISASDIGSRYFPIYTANGLSDINYYELRFAGDVTSVKWNDVTKAESVAIGGSPLPQLTFTNASTTVTADVDLTSTLKTGDMIWLTADGRHHMNSIETISFSGTTTITLTLPYDGAGGTGAGSYSQALPDIPAGKFVKHMLVRAVDDIMYLIMGQKLYDTAADAFADGAPSLPSTQADISILCAFITLEQGDTTLVGKLQDIRPLPFQYKIGGASGGGVSLSHSSLLDLTNDDHMQYLRTDGTRSLTGIQKYASHPTFTVGTSLIDKTYGDGLISAHENAYNHVDLAHALNTINRTGFENRSDSSLPATLSSASFTITGASFNIWLNGTKYVKSTETVTFANANGFWYIRYGASGVISASQTTFDLYNEAPIAIVFWNGTGGLVQDERHSSTRNIDWHVNTHNTAGAKYGHGLDAAFGDSSFSLSSGSIWSSDMMHTITAPTQCRVLYRRGSDWTWTAKQSGYYALDGGNVCYDNAGTITQCSAEYYVVYWMFAVNDPDCPIRVVMGQRQDATLIAAIANNEYWDIVLPDTLAERKVLYKIIIKNSASHYISHEDYRNVPSLSGINNAIPHSITSYRDEIGAHPATAISTDTTHFAGILTASHVNVQMALDAVSAITKSTLNLGSVTNDAQLKRSAGDFSSFANKAVIADTDVVLIEDSEDTGAKKYVTASELKKQSITFHAARNAIVAADSDLRTGDNVPTNVSPYVSPINCVLRSMSISNNVDNNRTWMAEVLVNDAQVATLLMSNSYHAHRSDLNVSVSAGDRIRLRFLLDASLNVDSPSISIFMIEQ